MPFSFKLFKTDFNSRARLGEFRTRHGVVPTPIFMPVGTRAPVRTLETSDLKQLDAKIILGNTYHLMIRPGAEVFNAFGGIHKFMAWDRPVLTDSGGFQVFSLSDRRKISEEGVAFQCFIEGKSYFLSPESAVQMQTAINSDIMMVLDHCIESTANLAETRDAMERTHRWALRSLAARTNPEQALFGIVQGGVHENLRRESAKFLVDHGFDGLAIGGLAVGETKSEREDMTELVADMLPQDKPRYLMGVGTPVDLLEAIKRGVDMFDCIIPTKMSQQGVVYTTKGIVKLKTAENRMSDNQIDENCKCETCQTYSRGYLHHLVKSREVSGWRLLSRHNVYFYMRLMEEVRAAIGNDQFMDLYRQKMHDWNVIESDFLIGENTRDPATYTHKRPMPPLQ